MLNSALVEPAQASPIEAPSPTSSVPLSPLARVGWAVLILITLGVCYFSHMGAIGFVGPDEPRYAWIARAMAESGDWVTPRLYGKPWFEKPPLYYWSAAISFKLFGVSEVAARLPSAFAALLATLAVAWLALRLYGAETARWLLLLLPTSVGMIGFSHAASTDMLFSATLTLALVSAFVALRIVAGPLWLAMLIFGFSVGLAVLAKGPAAIILLGGAVFFWALFTRRWRGAFRLFHLVALAAFFATALPWYLLCAHRNPGFFRIFIIEHNFKRYLTPEFQHIQPFWYYAAVLLAAFLPWTALFLWSLISGSLRLWRTHRISDATLLLLCWSAFTLLFFTISKSKLPGYILPAIPAIALLMTKESCLAASSKAKTFFVSAAAFIFATGYVLAGIFTFHRGGAPSFQAAEAIGWILAAFALSNLLLGVGDWFRLKSRSERFLMQCSVVPILVAALAAPRLLPAFFIGDPSGRTLAEALKRMNLVGGQVSAHRMNRAKRYSLSFYLHREVPEWDSLHPTEGYILESSRLASLTYSGALIIDPEPREVVGTSYFLYRVRYRSLDAASGGKMK